MIYFIQNSVNQAIKIGHSANPRARLSGLQSGTPDPLEMLAVTPGGPAEERIWHERFVDFRLAGEWFSSTTPSEEVLRWIEGINKAAEALSPFTEQKVVYPELCYLTSQAVGHAISICWIDWSGQGPGSPGCMYQVMYQGPLEGICLDFWRWHSLKQQAQFTTPEAACVAYVASCREWNRKGRPLADWARIKTPLPGLTE